MPALPEVRDILGGAAEATMQSIKSERPNR